MPRGAPHDPSVIASGMPSLDSRFRGNDAGRMFPSFSADSAENDAESALIGPFFERSFTDPKSPAGIKNFPAGR